MSSRVNLPSSGGGKAATLVHRSWSAPLTEPVAGEGSSRQVQRQPEKQEADGECSVVYRAGTAEGVQIGVKGVKVQTRVKVQIGTAGKEVHIVLTEGVRTEEFQVGTTEEEEQTGVEEQEQTGAEEGQ